MKWNDRSSMSHLIFKSFVTFGSIRIVSVLSLGWISHKTKCWSTNSKHSHDLQKHTLPPVIFVMNFQQVCQSWWSIMVEMWVYFHESWRNDQFFFFTRKQFIIRQFLNNNEQTTWIVIQLINWSVIGSKVDDGRQTIVRMFKESMMDWYIFLYLNKYYNINVSSLKSNVVPKQLYDTPTSLRILW
jgi:hypothetical protein